MLPFDVSLCVVFSSLKPPFLAIDVPLAARLGAIELVTGARSMCIFLVAIEIPHLSEAGPAAFFDTASVWPAVGSSMPSRTRKLVNPCGVLAGRI